METHTQAQHAPDERVNWEALHDQIVAVKSNVSFKELSAASSENVLILNTHRQIVFITRRCLDLFGINDPAEVYGCRLGEIMQCVHSEDGCGTTKMCKFCGVDKATRASLLGDSQSLYFCITQKHTEGKLTLLIQSTPITLKGEHYILLSLSEKAG
jgi:PAS domain-containing protein